MDEFSRYEKIPNSFKKLGLNSGDYTSLEKLDWVVTEKIHGANFSFHYENGQLQFAKRKEYLRWEDDFFGFQLVIEQIENQIIRLFEQLSIDFEEAKYIVYGELFGGEYPHPDIPINNDLQAIQTGIYYSPTIQFCAFDIAFENDEIKRYLDYENAIFYFEEFDIFHAQPLFVGKLSEALEFDIRINSTIPSLLDLPELDVNLIEGIVIKPFYSTESLPLNSRPILKLKNPEFSEEKKFHEAQKWSFIPNISSKSEELTFIVDEIKNYINENRLQSAISKIGALNLENEQRIEEIHLEFTKDVLNDFDGNNGYILNELTQEQLLWINERIKFEIQQFLM